MINSDASKYFKTLLKGINILLNKQRYTDNNYVDLVQDGISLEDVIATTKKLLDTGISKDDVFNIFLRDNGYNKNNLPESLKNIL